MIPLILGAASIAANLYSSHRQSRNQQNMLNQQTQADQAARQSAFDAGRFRPVGVQTGLAGSNFTFDSNGNLSGAGTTTDPRLSGLQSNLLGGASGMLNGLDTNQYINDYMDRYNQTAGAQQTNLFSNLQNRMAKQGLLGLKSNEAAVGGGTVGVNPMLASFSEGVARQNADAYSRAEQGAMRAREMDYTQGRGMLDMAMGIDRAGLDQLRLGADFGRAGGEAARYLMPGNSMDAAYGRVGTAQNAEIANQNSMLQELLRRAGPTSGGAGGISSNFMPNY